MLGVTLEESQIHYSVSKKDLEKLLRIVAALGNEVQFQELTLISS